MLSHPPKKKLNKIRICQSFSSQMRIFKYVSTFSKSSFPTIFHKFSNLYIFQGFLMFFFLCHLFTSCLHFSLVRRFASYEIFCCILFLDLSFVNQNFTQITFDLSNIFFRKMEFLESSYFCIENAFWNLATFNLLKLKKKVV